MAIQHRRGADKDFQPSKMLPAEIAITTDGTRKVYAAFAAGDVKELASKEDIQNIVDEFKSNTEDISKLYEENVELKSDLSNLGDSVSDISFLEQSENIYNGIYDSDKGLNNQGELVDLQDYSTTDFIRVVPNKTLYPNYNSGAQRSGCVIGRYAFYDSNKKFLRGTNSYWKATLPTEEDACYARMTFSNSYITTLAVNYDNIKSEYSDYKEERYVINSQKDIDNLMLNINGIYSIKNLVSPTDSTKNWSVVSATLGVTDNIIQFQGNGTGQYPELKNTMPFDYKKGHKYYCRVSVMTTSEKCQYISLRPLQSVSGTTFTINNITKGHWYTFSFFVTSTKDSGRCDIPFDVYGYFASNADSVNALINLKEITVIDTAELPQGLELYQIDKILDKNGFFNGTSKINVKECLVDSNVAVPNKIAHHTKPRAAVVTFIADDGFARDYDKMHGLSEKYGVPMCSAMPSVIDNQMSLPQILYCQNQLGWEFASHTYEHKNLKNLTSEEEIEYQMVESLKWMKERGINCTSLVYPEGGNDERVRRIAKKHFELACTTRPYVNTGVIPSFYISRKPLGSFYSTGTFDEYKGYVNEAIANDGWLIFMLHPTNAQHDTTQQEIFEQVIQYVQQNNIPILTLRDAHRQYFGNALEAGDYIGDTNGIAISGDGQKANI